MKKYWEALIIAFKTRAAYRFDTAMQVLASVARVRAGRRGERCEESGGQKRAATGKEGVRLHKMSRCENTR